MTLALERRAQLATASNDGDEQATRQLLADRSDGACEIHATRGCTGQATDWHHRQRRREGDDSIRNSLHLCRACHSWVHAHPTAARANGWIVPSWEDPVHQPVRIHGRWTLLTWDGGRTSTREPV